MNAPPRVPSLLLLRPPLPRALCEPVARELEPRPKLGPGPKLESGQVKPPPELPPHGEFCCCRGELPPPCQFWLRRHWPQ